MGGKREGGRKSITGIKINVYKIIGYKIYFHGMINNALLMKFGIHETHGEREECRKIV